MSVVEVSWRPLADMLDDGRLHAGELVEVFGVTGVGKTQLLCQLGANAAAAGCHVHFIDVDGGKLSSAWSTVSDEAKSRVTLCRACSIESLIVALRTVPAGARMLIVDSITCLYWLFRESPNLERVLMRALLDASRTRVTLVSKCALFKDGSNRLATSMSWTRAAPHRPQVPLAAAEHLSARPMLSNNYEDAVNYRIHLSFGVCLAGEKAYTTVVNARGVDISGEPQHIVGAGAITLIDETTL